MFVLVVDVPGGVMVWCRDGVWREPADVLQSSTRVSTVKFEDGCVLVRGFADAPSRPRLLHRRTVGV